MAFLKTKLQDLFDKLEEENEGETENTNTLLELEADIPLLGKTLKQINIKAAIEEENDLDFQNLLCFGETFQNARFL